MNLVEFIVTRKEWAQGQDFKKDAADSPVVHFVIVVAIGKEALRGPVPARADVFCERRLRVDSTARAEVCQFHEVIFDQDVFAAFKLSEW